MGFGHRVYRAEDPRARVLRRTARELGAPRFEVAEALEKAALAELHARKPDRVLATNVEFWSAVVLDFAEVPAHMFTSMFTCARVAGWSAHILEQKKLERLVRPSAIYVGPGRASRRTSRAGTRSRPADARRRRRPADAVAAASGRRASIGRAASSADRRLPRAPGRKIMDTAIPIPAELKPADGRFGAGPSKVRPAAVDALAARATAYLGTSHRQTAGTDQVARLRRGLAELLRPARRLRGHPRQRRHHRVLGRGHVRADPRPGPVRHVRRVRREVRRRGQAARRSSAEPTVRTAPSRHRGRPRRRGRHRRLRDPAQRDLDRRRRAGARGWPAPTPGALMLHDATSARRAAWRST